MANQLILPRQLDANGDPASGAKALVYETGTTTPVTVYTDTALSAPHASPIVADAAGYFAQAFYGGSLALKVVITDSADAALVTYDPTPQVSFSGSAAADITFDPTTEIPQTDVQAAIVEPIVFDRMDASALTGTDTQLVTGTPGVDGNNVIWGPNGDAIDGGPGASMVLLAVKVASASATLDFTELDGTKYGSYMFKMGGIVPATDGAVLGLITSSDGGSTYDATGGDYKVHIDLRTGVGPTVTDTGGNTASAPIASLVGNTSTDAVSGTVEVIKPHMAFYTSIHSKTTFISSSPNGAFAAQDGMSVRAEEAAVDAVRFLFDTGAITTGTIAMYGLRDS